MSPLHSNTTGKPVLTGFPALARRGVDIIDKVSMWVIVGSMGGMAALVAAQVFQRYIMDSSIDAADELSRLFFVWSMFLALPHGIRSGVHVGIDIFLRMMPRMGQDIAQRISALAGMILMIAVFVTALGATSDKWNELMPTLPVTAALYYIPVLICACHSVLHLALLLVCGPRIWEADATLEEGNP
ncbi:TRAP transporter small permease [Oceanibium sediminis]|uniref:TRAP transporter small permease n=1 Tax=Oceanibium sediminis TaxID=2026339 RepID=UPI0013005521|nr:TRAP transporter small permease [Oceanibium sediminis]